MNNVPQNETQAIGDDELELISGGGTGALILGMVATAFWNPLAYSHAVAVAAYSAYKDSTAA